MKQKNDKRQAYLCPEMEVVGVRMENLLQTVSGQHNPIGQGGGAGDAKQATFIEDRNAWGSHNLWDDPWKQ